MNLEDFLRTIVEINATWRANVAEATDRLEGQTQRALKEFLGAVDYDEPVPSKEELSHRN